MKTLAKLLVAALAALPQAALAQNIGAPGGSWSATWSFASSADRTLLLQQAEAMRQARNTGPTTVVNNYTTNDNRQNYQQIDAGSGTLGGIDFQLNGDRIDEYTNTIGAMNTGTTNIDITGSNNTVSATNAAESDGCLDGSISLSETNLSSFNTSMPLDFSLAEAARALDCGWQ